MQTSFAEQRLGRALCFDARVAFRLKGEAEIARRRHQQEDGPLGNGDRIAGFAGWRERNPNSQRARGLDVDAFVAGTRRLHEFQLRLAFHQLAIDLPGTQENLKIVCRRRVARMPRYEFVIGQTGGQMLELRRGVHAFIMQNGNFHYILPLT